MSRIGGAEIILPTSVEVLVEKNGIIVKGPKGELTQEIRPEVKVVVAEGKVKVTRKNNEKLSRALHGLTRSLINNMVIGVDKGWVRNLEMVGVGYRVQGGADMITLSVGFSHPVVVKAPAGIAFGILENTKISVSGIDKHLVGQVAANIRAIKPPEPYKGKGIRFAGEYVRRKAGKAGKAVTGAK